MTAKKQRASITRAQQFSIRQFQQMSVIGPQLLAAQFAYFCRTLTSHELPQHAEWVACLSRASSVHFSHRSLPASAHPWLRQTRAPDQKIHNPLAFPVTQSSKPAFL